MVILSPYNFSADHSVLRSEWSRIKINNQITGLYYYNFKKIPGFVRKSFSLELFNFPSSMDISLRTLAARYEISPNLAVNYHSTRIIGNLWNSEYSRPFVTSQVWGAFQTDLKYTLLFSAFQIWKIISACNVNIPCTLNAQFELKNAQ